MDGKLEIRARALCATDVDSASPPVPDREGAIERYWPVVAAEIAGGNMGMELPVDYAAREKEFRTLRRIPD